MADFNSYEQIIKWLGNGKKKSEGRRRRALMLRVRDGNVVVVSHARKAYATPGWQLTDFAEIRSNNVMTFITVSSDLIHCAASLSAVLWKVIGLEWCRVGKGRYVLFRRATPDMKRWWERRAAGHEHYRGMQWDISTGVCLNPRPSILKTVNRDKRKDWVASLKRFRRALHTRVKLGVVQSMIDTGKILDMPSVGLPELTNNILEAIKSGEVHTDLIGQIIRYTYFKGWQKSVDNDRFKLTVESIINGNSVRFRQEFGVLKE